MPLKVRLHYGKNRVKLARLKEHEKNTLHYKTQLSAIFAIV